MRSQTALLCLLLDKLVSNSLRRGAEIVQILLTYSHLQCVVSSPADD